MAQHDLLIELGSEELPPKSLKKLATAFANNIEQELEKLSLAFQQIEWFASPRRLAVKVHQLSTTQPDRSVLRQGPMLAGALDADGNPKPAGIGFARSCGVEFDQLEIVETPKGKRLQYQTIESGQSIEQLLQPLLENAIQQLPIPKPMRWGSSRAQFIRPVHWLMVLLGDRVLPCQLLGLDAANISYGHRFHSEGPISFFDASEYPAKLQSDGCVVADFAIRREQIRQQVEQLAAEHNAQALIDDDLLDEVTGLVEWPIPMLGTFEARFLDVPSEPLISTMKDNQKYFPLVDQQGQLLPKFVFISNLDSTAPEKVIEGNEKVVRPRLADAEFFFTTDKKQTLQSRLDSLKTVVFQQQLGTLHDKVLRIANVAEQVATLIDADAQIAARAGLLCKADLMTNMVGEFPDVQGIMGMHYARHDGEAEGVAIALNEQYMPRFSGDSLPHSKESCAVAIADKIDTLVGIFGIGQKPKGDKDPFALRRAAIGLLRIIVEKQLPLDVAQLIQISQQSYADCLSNSNVAEDVLDFLFARFRNWYQEQNISIDVIQAVLANRPTQPYDFDSRVKAVNFFRSLDSAQALSAANKRVGNILSKQPDLSDNAQIDINLLQEPAEQALATQLTHMQQQLQPLMAAHDYQGALSQLAHLREPVDTFFDNVMVMSDDAALKQNRLALLQQLRGLFLSIADISLLQQ